MKVCYAGLIAGAIFLLVSGGSPWTSAFFSSVMGRGLETASSSFSDLHLPTIGVHLALSVLYALVIIPLVHRLTISLAVIVGGIIGAGLYVVNYYVSANLLEAAVGERETAILLTHIVFGMVTAGTYKGLAKSSSEVT